MSRHQRVTTLAFLKVQFDLLSYGISGDLALVDLLREYRRLDDSITMRLNRTNAQFRDRDRAGTTGKGNVQDQTCAYIWKELVGEPPLGIHLKRSYAFPELRKLETAGGNSKLLRQCCRSVHGGEAKVFDKRGKRCQGSKKNASSHVCG